MAYSVQQIKFEMISYVKEFGGDFTDWVIGTADDAPKTLFESHGVDPERDMWLWKPALTPAAAALVRDWVVGRHQAGRAGDTEGACVFLFRKAGPHPAGCTGNARAAVQAKIDPATT